jgi:hypothetical protein
VKIDSVILKLDLSPRLHRHFTGRMKQTITDLHEALNSLAPRQLLAGATHSSSFASFVAAIEF